MDSGAEGVTAGPARHFKWKSPGKSFLTSGLLAGSDAGAVAGAGAGVRAG